MERVPMPCPFSLESGSPSSEKETGSLHGLEISNASFGVQIH